MQYAVRSAARTAYEHGRRLLAHPELDPRGRAPALLAEARAGLTRRIDALEAEGGEVGASSGRRSASASASASRARDDRLRRARPHFCSYEPLPS